LCECADAGLEALLTNVGVDALAQRRQMRQHGAGAVADTELGDGLHRAIDRHPCHDLRMGEMAPAAANLSDALVDARLKGCT
jgi:hypothetical protein